MGCRWCSLVFVAMVAACQFDPSGTATGGDDSAAIDAAGSSIDGAPSPIDASETTPMIDAGENPGPVTCGGATCPAGNICCVDFDGGPATCSTEQACQGSTLSCDQPSDCPGEDCCMYGGWGSTCSPTCIGGDQVCDTAGDCGGLGGACCPTNVGPKVCRAVCF